MVDKNIETLEARRSRRFDSSVVKAANNGSGTGSRRGLRLEWPSGIGAPYRRSSAGWEGGSTAR